MLMQIFFILFCLFSEIAIASPPIKDPVPIPSREALIREIEAHFATPCLLVMMQERLAEDGRAEQETAHELLRLENQAREEFAKRILKGSLTWFSEASMNDRMAWYLTTLRECIRSSSKHYSERELLEYLREHLLLMPPTDVQ